MTDPTRESAGKREPVHDEYEMTMLLERLESLIEEMDESAITDRASAEAFPAVGGEMDGLAVRSRAEAVARAASLSAQLDASF